MSRINRRGLQVVLFASMMWTAVPANAGTIIGGAVFGGTAFTGGGTFVKLAPPFSNPFGPAGSVGEDTFQSLNLYGFDEVQNVPVLSPPATGLVTDVGMNNIAVGTMVSSHYIFFDPASVEDIIATVDFDSDVLAIITSTGNLLSSDYFAANLVNYLNPTARGLEAGDSVTISGLRQITFATSANSPGDYVRVITVSAPVTNPEPGTGFALAGGAGILWLLRRRGAKRTRPTPASLQ
jgi:hypothetical protein